MSIIVPSNHTRIGAWVNSKIGEKSTSLVYCTIPFIATEGYHTNIEDTGSLGYNLFCYITSRIGWVSLLKGIYRYNRCRRDPGKLYNDFCYTYFNEISAPA